MILNCANQSVALNGSVTNGTPLWTGPGINAGNENQLMPVVNIAGTYVLTATSPQNCIAMDTVVVNVDPQTIMADAGPPDTFNCIIDTIFLQGGPSGANITYQWSGPGINAGNEHDQNPLITVEGVYTLIVTDQATGCISVPDSVVIGDDSYQVVAIIQGPTELTCFIDTIDLATIGSTTGPAIRYLWLDENGAVVSSSANFIVTQSGQFTFVVQDTVTGCADSTTIDIEDLTQYPQVNAGPDQVLDCNNLTVFLTGITNTGINIEHTWDGPPGGILTDPDLLTVTVGLPGTYIFSAMDTTLGCLNMDTVMVIQNAVLPFAEINIAENITCLDNTALLNVGNSSSGPEYDYEWTGPGVNGATTTSVETTSPGTYTMTVTNASTGCEASDTVSLVLPVPPSDILASIEIPLCAGDMSGSLSVTQIVGGTPVYTYSLDGGAPQDSADFLNLTAGTYSVIVTDGNGCTYEEEFIIPDGQILTIDIGPDLDLVLGDSVILDPLVNLPWSQIDSIVWALGDHLSCTHCINPTYYALVESEIITATVYTSGCLAQDDLLVTVDIDAEFWVPNVFSPNDDGINDHVTVFADERVKRVLYLEIFDRWGNQVFKANNILPNDPLLGWDGTFKEKPMNPAVFAYIASVELINGQTLKKKGDITLLR